LESRGEKDFLCLEVQGELGTTHHTQIIGCYRMI
jgi:hypothetical protein